MNASFDREFDPQSERNESFPQAEELRSMTRAGVVNRTHRVVRQRAKVIKARRSYVRSLMLPLIVCSALLILTIVAVWSGLYRTEAVEAVQDVANDVANLAPSDGNDEFMVALLWFVPVTLALLGAVWLRHVRGGTGGEAIR